MKFEKNIFVQHSSQYVGTHRSCCLYSTVVSMSALTGPACLYSTVVSMSALTGPAVCTAQQSVCRHSQVLLFVQHSSQYVGTHRSCCLYSTVVNMSGLTGLSVCTAQQSVCRHSLVLLFVQHSSQYVGTHWSCCLYIIVVTMSALTGLAVCTTQQSVCRHSQVLLFVQHSNQYVGTHRSCCLYITVVSMSAVTGPAVCTSQKSVCRQSQVSLVLVLFVQIDVVYLTMLVCHYKQKRIFRQFIFNVFTNFAYRDTENESGVSSLINPCNSATVLYLSYHKIQISIDSTVVIILCLLKINIFFLYY